MANIGDTVMILMSHPKRFVFAWDGKEFVLEKDKEKFIPFELAANYFGDPRAVGAIQSTQDHKRRVGWIPDRPTEVRRLRVLYGVQHGDENQVFLPDGLVERLPDTGDWPARKDHWTRIDANIPRVQMYDLETRTRLYTVLEDPIGEHVTPALVTITKEQQMQSRIDRLEELVQSLTNTKAPEGESLVTPEGIVGPDPNAQPRPQSDAERMIREAHRRGESGEGSDGDWFEDEQKVQQREDLITSERSGAAGLPADRA